MSDGRVLFESASRIDDTALARIRKGVGAPGDVLLSHKGTVGKVAFASLHCEPFVCSPQTTFWRSLDESRLDRRYLYYYLCSSGFQNQLRSRAAESDMAPYVSLTVQRTLSVKLPPIGTQRSIARRLSALDDKVELNRRMNCTLESIARAIFRSWFVDFDPVRKRMEGREARLGSEHEAVFPTRLEREAESTVPAGWRMGVLSDLLVLQRGFDLPTTLRTPGPYPVVSASGVGGGHLNVVSRDLAL